MSTENAIQKGTIDVFVCDEYGTHLPIVDASVRIFPTRAEEKQEEKDHTRAQYSDAYQPSYEGVTGTDGHFQRQVESGSYTIWAEAFGVKCSKKDVRVDPGCRTEICVEIPMAFSIGTFVLTEECKMIPCAEFVVGKAMYVRIAWRRERGKEFKTTLTASKGHILDGFKESQTNDEYIREYLFDSNDAPGVTMFTARLQQNPYMVATASVTGMPDRVQVGGDVTVTMRRAATEATEDLPLWVVIRKSTEAISFNNYFRFMNHVLCGEPLSLEFSEYELSKIPGKKTKFDALQKKRFLPFTDADAYRILKVATEAFLIVNCGVALATFPFSQDDLDYVIRRVGRSVDLSNLWGRYLEFVNGTSNQTIPYLALIRDKLRDVRIKDTNFEDADLPEECFGILRHKLTEPCLLELIWSYWHEEGMLVQTVNAITRRFQNVRGAKQDPLANLEIDPLRPLNNLFWGYLQDEQHRLSVVRRGYEYDHHYGLRLYGKAVPELRPADSRSKFLEAFHNLLHLCTLFFQQDDDTTVVADGFPLLNALKEVHLILSQGAHNQFGDLPSTARIEMLMQEWLLARPEFREFLPTRIMVAYPEPWMDRVDAMKKLQGWTDASVLHFRNLGMFGEQILLSIRYGAWSDVNDPVQAANWARFWRPEIQGYIHAYRAATGVDLTLETVDFTLPSVHLQKRLAMQQRNAVR
jgi:hypothetical protein